MSKTKEEFEKAAEGLLRLAEPDLSAEVVAIEPITGGYFRDGSRQRCIVRKNGRLFVADYD
jgi:hypothetical protein